MENENTNTPAAADSPTAAAAPGKEEQAANSIPVASPSFLGETHADFWDDNFINS